MFCPNCGKSEQIENSYCRRCGEFLNYSNKHSALSFGGNSPQQNVNTINILSLIAAFISLFAGIWMYATQFNVPIVLYFAAAILLCNTGWHLSNFIVGTKLKKRLNQAKEKLFETDKHLQSAKTKELLPEANFENYVPTSITENTTKHLKEKVNKVRRQN